MSLNIFLLINFVTYIFTLKIFFYIFKTKYYFPFRYADFFNFLFNLFFFAGLSLYCYNEFFWITIFINLNLFYIFFHLINMIITSPRTKIIIDLIDNKKKELDLTQYLKKYNCKKIVENRIKRLKTSKQISEKNNLIKLNKKNKNFFYLIALIFSFIEKI
jgi:hypothetical protein|tara:strand:+ start:703 stop:1182 length:480 start_codon:yes stop_codon:yes gene_type:complete